MFARTSIVTAGLLLAGGTLHAQVIGSETPESGWLWYGAVYAWPSGVTGTVTVGSVPVPINEDFTDLAENVDFGISGRVEAHHASGWAVFGDVFYADLGAKGAVPGTPDTVEVDQKEVILEAGVGYEVVRDLEVLAVTRYNDLRLTVGLVNDPTPPLQGDLRWLDVFGGVRYTPSLGERWLLIFRGEIGGGGSDLSFFAAAVANYAISDGLLASLGYRVLSVDRNETPIRWDVVMHGISLGVLFRF